MWACARGSPNRRDVRRGDGLRASSLPACVLLAAPSGFALHSDARYRGIYVHEYVSGFSRAKSRGLCGLRVGGLRIGACESAISHLRTPSRPAS
eukprot:14535936-Alexandrium_andersonii.AAC.1